MPTPAYQIQLFGGFRAPSLDLTEKEKVLLAYVLSHGGYAPTQPLATALWPDESWKTKAEVKIAKGRIGPLVLSLRRKLGDTGSVRERQGVEISGLTCDLNGFEALIRRAREAESAGERSRLYREALAMTQAGNVLQGNEAWTFLLTEAPNDWIQAVRKRVYTLKVECLGGNTQPRSTTASQTPLSPPDPLFFEASEAIRNERSERVFGREAISAEVALWLNSDGPARRLLTAAAGVGKTAFLAQLTMELPKQGWVVVSHFFSQVRQTTSVDDAYRSLLYQLSLHDGGAMPSREEDPRVALALRLRAWEGGPLLIVMDGLDEADREMRDSSAFRQTVTGVFVLTSYRADGDIPRWVLQWDDTETPQTLPPLEPTGVFAWMRALPSLAPHANASLAERLCDHAEGLPLYLTYLMEDIAQQEDPRTVLENTPPGLDAYVAQEVEQFRADNRFSGPFLKLLALLTIAKSPLPVDVALRVLGSDLEPVEIANAPQSVQRWWRRLRRDDAPNQESTLAFAHPRLTEAFTRSAVQGRRWLPALLAWTESHWQSGCAYSLRHVADHLLDDAREQVRDATLRQLALPVDDTSPLLRLQKLLDSLPYIDRKLRAGQCEALHQEFQSALGLLPLALPWQPDFQPCFATHLSFFRFLQRTRHLLERQPEYLHDLALQTPADDPVHAAVDQMPHLSTASRLRWLSPDTTDDTHLCYIGHRSGEIEHLILTTDERRLISIDAFGGLLVHNANTGALLQELRAGAGSAIDPQLFSDDRTLALTNLAGELEIWDLDIGYQRSALLLGVPGETHLTRFPHQDTLLAACPDGTLYTWNHNQGLRHRGHVSTQPTCVSPLIPDSIVLGGEDGALFWIHPDNTRALAPRHSAEIAFLLPDPHTLGRFVSLDSGPQAYLWDLARDTDTAVFSPDDAPTQDEITTAALTPEGDGLLLGDARREYVRWRFVRPRPQFSGIIPGSIDAEPILGFGHIPNNPDVCFVASSTVVQAVDARDGHPIHRFRGHHSHLERLLVSPAGTRLWAAGREPIIHCWHTPDSVLSYECAPPDGADLSEASDVTAMAYLDPNTLLVSTLWGGLTTLDLCTGYRAPAWETPESGGYRWLIPGQPLLCANADICLAVSETGQRRVLWAADSESQLSWVQRSTDRRSVWWMETSGVLTRFDLETGRPESTRFGGPRVTAACRLHHDGRLIVARDGADLEVWDVARRTRIARSETPHLEITHLSAASATEFWSGGFDGTVLRWRITPTGALERSYACHAGTGPLTGLCLGASDTLITTNEDLSLCHWNPRTGQRLDRFLLPGRPLCVVALSPRIAVGSRDGIIFRLEGPSTW